ncbi:MAG: (2Fe-2S)-binding protein [Hyphomicrobiaceae bacterium]
MAITLAVNGASHTVEVDPETPLLWVLRDALGLTGTKYGCGIAACGACTVHINGVAVRSCQVAAKDAIGVITTIEGLSAKSDHPLQKAWIAADVPQCGYCQSGMIMAAAALIKEKPKLTAQDIEQGITNICRCGTYGRIKAAILQATKAG